MRVAANAFPAFDFAVLLARVLERVFAAFEAWGLVGRLTIDGNLGGSPVSVKNVDS